MKKTSFGMVTLLGLALALPAVAQTPEQKGPAAPGKAQAKGNAEPGKPGPGAKSGAAQPAAKGMAGGATNAKGREGAPPGGGFVKGPPHTMMPPGHGNMTPEQMKEMAAKRQERMAERSKELREKALKARASGDVKQAEQLDRAADRLEGKGPRGAGMLKKPTPGPAWEKQKKARKMAQLRPLWKKYGERLKEQPVRAEFKKHAQRVARLQRMRELAETQADEKKRTDLLQRIDELLSKEKVRHQRAMQDALEARKDAVTKAEKGNSPGDGKASKPGAGNPSAATAPAANVEEEK